MVRASTKEQRVEHKASNIYKMQRILTAPGVKLVAMLYDKAIDSLKDAVHAIEVGNIQARWNANLRAQEILTHLSATLDHSRGGEIAENLDRLYRFMLARLFLVDVNNDPKPALDVIALLEPLRASWHELANQGPAPIAEAPTASDALSKKNIAVSA